MAKTTVSTKSTKATKDAKSKDVKNKETKKKVKKSVPKANVFIKSSYNNTIITIADLEGNVLGWSSPGVIGYKGSKKSTAYAATKAAEDLVSKCQKYNINEATVMVKGSGMGRQAAVKGLRSAGLKIRSLMDVTPIPHGGPSPRKKPRGS
ncbi:30S ribosomal protein S11 [Candidatus Dojkabacteria bacterium]|nr:30S ribosomal protein S11 [Candidatus Dojkabacteria bacterium]